MTPPPAAVPLPERLTPERCLRVICLLGLEGCELGWLGKERDELWACCIKCKRRRVFLKHLSEIQS